MDQVLAAVQGIDSKLNGISSNILQLNTTQDELRSLYGTLSDEIQRNEKKQQDRWLKIEERLRLLEEVQEGRPGGLNTRDNFLEDTRAASEQMKPDITEILTLRLSKMSMELTANVNRALETMDQLERRNIKLNLVIRGLSQDNVSIEERAKNLLAEKFNIQEGITSVKSVDNGSKAIVTVNSWNTKLSILKRKKDILANTRIFIDPDLTQREQRIAAELRRIAREKKLEGPQVRLSYQRIRIDEQWYTWDDFGNRLLATNHCTSRQARTTSTFLRNCRESLRKTQRFYGHLDPPYISSQ